ncbi:MAG: alpha/beta hydrolase [Bacteroidales bacterium]|nr:alpha/beta hydrolase [Bacteroidales bacterium]
MATASKKEQIFAENEDIQVYIWEGNDKKILITHGWAGMAADFKEMIKALHQAGFTVMAFDLPAHGFSSGKHTHMPMVMEVIKSIIEKYGSFYAMIGHSLGAASTTYALAEIAQEKKPEKLVLLGVPPAPFVFFEQFRSLLSINDKLFDKCVKYVEKMVGRKIQDMSIEKSFPKVSVQNILIIHDIEDNIIPLEEVKTIADKWENAHFFSGNHGGHFRHYKHTDVVKKVKSFISN